MVIWKGSLIAPGERTGKSYYELLDRILKAELLRALAVGQSVLVEVPIGKSMQHVMKQHTAYAACEGYTITQTGFSASNFEKGLLIGVVKVERLEDKNPGPHVCIQCGGKFKSPYLLKQHLKKH